MSYRPCTLHEIDGHIECEEVYQKNQRLEAENAALRARCTVYERTMGPEAQKFADECSDIIEEARKQAAVIEAVRALHVQDDCPPWFCKVCGRRPPCPTIAALEIAQANNEEADRG